MAILIKKNNYIVVDKALLSFGARLTLENGEPLQVDLKEIDGRKLSDDQRKFIFALCSEFEKCTGDDAEIFRASCMNALNEVYDLGKSTLTKYSVADGNKLINLIISTLIRLDIPISVKLLNYYNYQLNQSQIYAMCLKRICCVCGKKADLHHVDAVGRGFNRKTIDHIGKRMLPLCREHHNEVHNIGDNEFLQKYHLKTIKIDEKLQYFIKKGKIKIIEKEERNE